MPETNVEDEDSGLFSNFFRQFFSRKKSKYDYSYLYKGKDVKGKISIDLEEAFLGSERVIKVFNENLRIKIKPGVKNHQVIKVKNKGAYGDLGAQRGDLIITILIKPNQIFKRKENDLYREINISIYTAILGGKIQFETLHGSVIIGIPEGTKEGAQLRVKGKGMPLYSNAKEFGDLYVKIQYKMPVSLTDEEKSLLNKLKEINKLKESKSYL
jgi:curved DNA-binding protein